MKLENNKVDLTDGNVTATAFFAPNFYGDSTASGNIKINSTSHATDGEVIIENKYTVITDNTTNSTAKAGRLMTAHYLAAEEPCTIAYYDCGASENVLNIGGGTSLGNAATGIKFFTTANNNTVTGTVALRIQSTGTISTGAETAPDVDPFGLCLNTGTGDNNIFTFKNSDIAHGITDVAETDTFMQSGKLSSTTGGCIFSGFSEDIVGMELRGYSTNPNTSRTTAAVGCIRLNSLLKSGTGVTAFASTGNIFTVSNNGDARMICKGDGELLNDYSTAMSLYDNENDIEIARNAQLAIGKGFEYIDKQAQTKLEELGIMENGFVSQQKMTALQLGTLSQLWNAISGIAKMLGIEEKQLLTIAQTYK